MHRMGGVSVIIVNYNVRYFLKQCIQSVLKSHLDTDLEIIVVDNNSSDGSVEMLRKEFPAVHCISNETNLGFGKANNMAIKMAKGDYVLILNPDTIIEEQTLQICFDYLQNNPDAGALGVKMVDGSGTYLPESKRGFPTPLRSFFKISGMASLIPRSKLFNGYYLGHLDPDSTQEVDVLTGAFLFTRKTILTEVGGFDEDYFMYGEDIEICYQIKKLGKKIIYYPFSSIIHFKGESTRKASLNYIKRFYGAMQIYASKRHNKSSLIWKLILKLGIVAAGLSSFLKSLSQKWLWPVVNFLFLFLFAKAVQRLWASLYYKVPSYYDQSYSDKSIAVLVWLLVVVYYIFGQYDKSYSRKQWIYAAFISGLTTLSAYALFPLDWRFSRAVLLALLFSAPFIMYLMRLLYSRLNSNNWSLNSQVYNRILVIGKKDSYESVRKIIDRFYTSTQVIKRVFDEEDKSDNDFVGNIKELDDIISLYKINEIIFCTRDLAHEKILSIISGLNRQIAFKIASNDNVSILGSSSKNSLGDWYTLDIDFKIRKEFHRRTKRMIDLSFSFILLLFSPLFLLKRNSSEFYKNLPSVIMGKKTWIGYERTDQEIQNLPYLKPSVFPFTIYDSSKQKIASKRSNTFYARNYSVWLEMDQLFRHSVS
jgi:GT2 family glycosyltransferase